MSKRKGSLPPPEAPPTSVMKSSSFNSGISSVAVDPSPPGPLTNGVVPHGDEKVSSPDTSSKQKRHFKLTRAFTSGSLRIGKTKKKSKNTTSKDDCEITAPVMATAMKRRTIIGGISEDGEDLWRLPGIDNISKVKLKSPKPLASSASDSSLLGRELPPVPNQGKPADSRELLLNRELPPLPSPKEDTTRTQNISPSPPLVSSDANTDVLGQQANTQSTISVTSDEGGPMYINTLSPKDASPTCDTPSPIDSNPTEASASSNDMGPTYVNAQSLKDADANSSLKNDVNPATPTSTKVTSPSTPLRNGTTPDSLAMDTAEMLKQISMLPELPSCSEETDPNANNFRPLPKTPPNSDPNDEEMGRLVPSPVSTGVPKERRDGLGEAEQNHDESSLNAVGNGVKDNLTDAPDASPELPAGRDMTVEENKLAGNNVKGSSSVSGSSLTPVEQPSTQETDNELRDYTIGEVVTTYSYALPARVRILQGYCSDSMEVNISTEDVYDVHSVQRTRNVIVKDVDGMMHRIPFESPVKVGLIYDPNNNYNTSLNGCTYKNISEVTSLSVLPKVIAATVRVSSGEEKNSVSEGEVFVVKQVQRSMFKVKKGLRVYSLLTKSDKFLLDDCPGHFSTKPSLVRMGLPELLGEVSEIYPSHCVIYPTVSYKSDFPGEFQLKLPKSK